MAILDTIKKFVFPVIDDEDDEMMEAEAPRSAPRSVREEMPALTSTAPSKKAKVVSIGSGSAHRIVVVKLDSNSDVKVIIDHLKEKTPVIFNIARLDRNEATRAVDVVYGASYAVDGSMQKVSNDIFVVTPFGTEIAGDISELMGSADEFSLDI